MTDLGPDGSSRSVSADYNGPIVADDGIMSSETATEQLSITLNWRLLLPLLIALAGAGLVLFHTRFGPGASGDSAFYVMGAENLASGRGYARYSGGYELDPITGFPPLYSMTLAGLIPFGSDLFALGRLLNVVLFGLNLLIVGWLLARHTRSLWAAAAGQGLMLTSATQVGLHSWIMSEPLFTFLSLIALWLTVVYVRKGSMLAMFALGASLSMAFLTRYVGASLIAASLTTILLLSRGDFWNRLKRVAGMAVIAGVPILIWFWRNAQVAESLTNRELLFHPLRPGLIRLYLAEVSSWFVPHEVPLPTAARAVIAIALVFGLTGLYLYGRIAEEGKKVDESADPLPHWIINIRPLAAMIILYAAAFGGILAINSLFLDAATTASAPPRYLAPLYVALVIFFVIVGYWVGWEWDGSVARTGLLLVAMVTVGYSARNTWRLISDPIQAMGYMGHRYDWPQVRSELTSIEKTTPIISNNPELVYVLSGRPAYVRPIRFDVYQDQAREDFRHQVDATEEKLERGGVYVIFYPIEEVDRDVIRMTGAQLLQELPQAALYGFPETGEAGDV